MPDDHAPCNAPGGKVGAAYGNSVGGLSSGLYSYAVTAEASLRV
jgi:hypothetical protein